MKALLAIAAILMAGGGGSADDHGGKVVWIRDPQFGLGKAKLEGRPAMLFFTADWCGYCKQLGATAMSDEKVAAAAQRVVAIYVDCTRKGEQTELLNRYKVQAFPAVLYTDADGGLVREMESRDASGILKDIDAVTAKVAPRPTMWQPSVALAKEAARKAKKPVAIFFADPKTDLAKMNAKLARDLGDRKTKFFWVLESASALKKYETDPAPAIVVLDPATDEALARIAFKADDKGEALNKALDDAAKLLKK
ncbi:MAG: thioredoxin family protein [Planctomycetes bacterium]|nr:thioredoxin family protein [Planctomycetota bacterium]